LPAVTVLPVMIPVSGSAAMCALYPSRYDVGGLVYVAGLGIHRGHDPVAGDRAGDSPLAGLLAGFDVLAGDQCQQRDRQLLLIGQPGHGQGIDDRQRIANQLRDQRVAGDMVVPRDIRFADAVIVVCRHRDIAGGRHELADLADRRDQLGDRILGRYGVIQHGRVQRPAGTPVEDTGLAGEILDCRVDAVRTIACVQPARQYTNTLGSNRRHQASGPPRPSNGYPSPTPSRPADPTTPPAP
jgi:hypothetical protein